MRYFAVVGLVLVAAALAVGAEPKRPKLDAILASPAELHFDRAKVEDVAEWLERHHHLPVDVDNASLDDSLLFDETISGRIKGATLAGALTGLLQPYCLDWTICDGVVVFTTEEHSSHVDITRIYRVTDATRAKAIAAELPAKYRPASWLKQHNPPHIYAYGRAVILRHKASDHIAIATKYAAELKLAETSGCSLLPRKLCEHVDIEFVEAKLPDVAAWLEKETGLTVRVDERSLVSKDVDPNLPVTVRIKGRPLRTALTTLLNQYDLQWFVKGEVLSIVSEEESLDVHAVHDIRGLVIEEDYDALEEFIAQNVAIWREGSGPLPIHFAVPNHVVVEADYGEQLSLATKLDELRWALRQE